MEMENEIENDVDESDVIKKEGEGEEEGLWEKE